MPHPSVHPAAQAARQEDAHQPLLLPPLLPRTERAARVRRLAQRSRHPTRSAQRSAITHCAAIGGCGADCALLAVRQRCSGGTPGARRRSRGSEAASCSSVHSSALRRRSRRPSTIAATTTTRDDVADYDDDAHSHTAPRYTDAQYWDAPDLPRRPSSPPQPGSPLCSPPPRSPSPRQRTKRRWGDDLGRSAHSDEDAEGAPACAHGSAEGGIDRATEGEARAAFFSAAGMGDVRWIDAGVLSEADLNAVLVAAEQGCGPELTLLTSYSTSSGAREFANWFADGSGHWESGQCSLR